MIFDIVQIGAIAIWLAIVGACIVGGYVFARKVKKPRPTARIEPAPKPTAAERSRPTLATSSLAHMPAMHRPALKPIYVSPAPAPASSSGDISTALLFWAVAMHASESRSSAPCSAPSFSSGGGGDYGGGGASGSWDSGSSSSSSDSSGSSSSDSGSSCSGSD